MYSEVCVDGCDDSMGQITEDEKEWEKGSKRVMEKCTRERSIKEG